jgi:hypothetical protein
MTDDHKAKGPAGEDVSPGRKSLLEWSQGATETADVAGWTIVGGWPVDPDTLLPIGLRPADAPDGPRNPEGNPGPTDGPAGFQRGG